MLPENAPPSSSHQHTRLTKRTVDAARPGPREYFLWCGATRGFGLRVYPSGKKVFVAQVRVGRATRRIKIGAYGPFTVDQARDAANDIIRSAAKGVDPQKEKRKARMAMTVSELCDAYMEQARAGLVFTRFGQPKRLSTVAVDEGRVSRHIKPLIGQIPVQELDRFDVQHMADQIAQGRTRHTQKTKRRGKAIVRGGAGTASRVVSFFGGVYSWAEKRGFAPGPNPVRGVDTARFVPRDRVLSSAELGVLGDILDTARDTAPQATAAMNLIALTGLRRQEACALQWREIDSLGHCLRLLETKTGKSVRPIGRHALALLQSLPRGSSQWVFPNGSDTGCADLKKDIAALFNAAGLRDARSHDLRRTYASVAADEGYSDATIAALLGHAQRGVTARHYIRRPDEALIAAADRTSARITACLSRESAEVVRIARLSIAGAAQQERDN